MLIVYNFRYYEVAKNVFISWRSPQTIQSDQTILLVQQVKFSLN